MEYAESEINKIKDGMTTTFAISSNSINSVISAIIPMAIIILNIPILTGFRTCMRMNIKEHKLKSF
jgi:hypothetical protein